MRCSIAFSALAVACAAQAAEPTLTFKVSGEVKREMALSELKAAAGSFHATFFDPRYGKAKSYDCLPMAAVMDAGFGSGWSGGARTEAVLTASDGFASVASVAKLRDPGSCLAFADLDFPNWEPVGRKQVSPAPFYLAWTQPEEGTENDYPWPYQLVSIDLVAFAQCYPHVVPLGAKPGSAAERGFEIFRDRCLRCHSISQEGGKIGPDLNAPQNVTTYRSKSWLKSYIRQPSKYRYTEMPDHTDLTDAQLDDLYQYLRWLAKQPGKA